MVDADHRVVTRAECKITSSQGGDLGQVSKSVPVAFHQLTASQVALLETIHLRQSERGGQIIHLVLVAHLFDFINP